jgi:DNA-binding CsgD family transcriptional regulator
MIAATNRTPFQHGVSRADPHPPSHGAFHRPGLIETQQRASAHPSTLSTGVDAALYAFVEHFEEGVAVVDRTGSALFLNRAARAIVGGAHLFLVDGYLRARAPNTSMALRKMIARCAADGCGSAIRLVGEDDTLLIAASPIPTPGFPSTEASILLRLINPARIRLPDGDALRDHFGLTPTEAAFALELLAGNDLATSAARRGIAPSTGRVHLRRLFEKTGTHRQAALIRLLLLCPRPMIGQGMPG